MSRGPSGLKGGPSTSGPFEPADHRAVRSRPHDRPLQGSRARYSPREDALARPLPNIMVTVLRIAKSGGPATHGHRRHGKVIIMKIIRNVLFAFFLLGLGAGAASAQPS